MSDAAAPGGTDGSPVPGETDPAPSELAQCVEGHKRSFETHYGKSRQEWGRMCAGGVEAGDILAYAKHECKGRYDGSLAPSVGLPRDAWDRFCEDEALVESPHDFLMERLRAYVMTGSPDAVTPEQAWHFMGTTSDTDSPAVRAKRAELAPLLDKALEARRRLGVPLAGLRLPLTAAAGLQSEDQLREWSRRFDLGPAAAAPLAPGAGAVCATCGSAPPGGGAHGPLKPALSMRVTGGELESPAQVKDRLQREVAALSMLRDDHGKALYDARAIELLRAIVDVVPVEPARPGGPDRALLEGARRTVEVFAEKLPLLVWDPRLKDYGQFYFETEGDVPLLKGAVGDRRYKISLRPGPAGAPRGYSREQLAMALVHEAGGHAWTYARGGGESDLTDEIEAFSLMNMFGVAFMQDFERRLAVQRAELESRRAALEPEEIAAREASIKDLERRSREFLIPKRRDDLGKWMRDPRGYNRDRVANYYGEEEQLKPGLLTPDQIESSLRTRLDEARGASARARERLAQAGWMEGLAQRLDLGSITSEERAADDAAAVLEKRLGRVAKDREFDRARREREAGWRRRKGRECDAFLSGHPGYQELEERAQPLTLELERAAEGSPRFIRIEGQLAELERQAAAIRDLYVACRVY